MSVLGKLALTLSLVVGASGCSKHQSAQASSCDPVLGKWAWFTNGVVTINQDGTLVHDPGNDGTWECSDASRGAITIHWRQGGFVNQMALSADGSTLSSTDPAQGFVTARRLEAGTSQAADASAIAQPSDASQQSAQDSGPLVLETQDEGGQILAMHLPDLMRRATSKAQEWEADAIPVGLEYEYLDPPNPAMKGPQVRLSFFSPSKGTGQFITVTPKGASTYTFRQPVHWGQLSMLPVFVDLPAAVRIAKEHGGRMPVKRASIRVWSPGKAPPVLAWMLGGMTLEGTTGEIINFDVTGYIAAYNEQWERAARGLRALLRAATRSHPVGDGGFVIGGDGGAPSSSEPYDDGSAAREQYERDAARGRAYNDLPTEQYNRIQGGECSWDHASAGYC